MNHIKTFILLLVALMSSLGISSISTDTHENKTQKEDKTTTNRQEEIDGLVAIVSKKYTGTKEHKEAANKLADFISCGKYTPDLHIFDIIMSAKEGFTYELMIRPEYRLMDILEQYDKVFTHDKSSTCILCDGWYTLTRIIEHYSSLFSAHHCIDLHGRRHSFYQPRALTNYDHEIVKKIDRIFLKNLSHFSAKAFIPRLRQICLDKEVSTKIVQHVIDRIKAKKYEPDSYYMQTLLSSRYLNKDQATYILNYIRSNHKNKEWFEICIHKDIEHCYIDHDFILGMFDEINDSYQKDKSQYNTDFILHVLDLFTTCEVVITCATDKIRKRAQDLLLKHLDKLTPDKLAFALTARYLDDEAGKKVAKLFMEKLSSDTYKPEVLDLIYALHSQYLNTKQRGLVLDKIIKTYDKNIKPLHKCVKDITYYNSYNHPYEGFFARLHGYGDNDGAEIDTGALILDKDLPNITTQILCNCKYYTRDQFSKILAFIDRNYNLDILFTGYKCAQNYENSVTEKQLQDLFDRILATDDNVWYTSGVKGRCNDGRIFRYEPWYVALHKSATDDQRLRAIAEIMRNNDTEDFIKASLQKLKKPLRDRCGAGDKCTDGKGPCCLASIKKYSESFKGRPIHFAPEVKYVKFDGISRWPLEDKFVRPQPLTISGEELAKYLDNIDNLDLYILCRIMKYAELDKGARKKVLEKIKLLERYLRPKHVDLLVASDLVPKSYKKKLVKQMMEVRLCSRAMVACKQTSLKDALHIFKYCNHHTFNKWYIAAYFGGYDNAIFDDPELYAPYADKYMDILQSWIDQGDPDQSGESVYMQRCTGSEWGDEERDAYCGCNDAMCELLELLRQGDLPEKQTARLFKYFCYYFDRFLYFAGHVSRCSFYYNGAGGWALPAMDRINNILCHKFTDEQFDELFKIIGKYADKFAPEDLTSYLTSDIINQACKDILWKAMKEKGVVLPDEAVKFLRENGVGVRS